MQISKCSKWGLVPLIAAALCCPPRSSEASSASALCSATVSANISIGKVADMSFGSSPAGAPGQELNPQSDPDKAAKFQVRGEPNASYQISLPTDGVVYLQQSSGTQPKHRIAITGFKSMPANAGMIGSDGTQMLFVGATRAPLAADQPQGAYSAAFVVSVVY